MTVDYATAPYPWDMKRWFWVLDIVVVLSFVVVGRDSHGFVTDWEETARVAAPFLIGLGVAALAVRPWRNPASWITGLALGIATTSVGMLLRWLVWEDGTAPVFIVVTSAWIIGLMIAWRVVFTVVASLWVRRTQ